MTSRKISSQRCAISTKGRDLVTFAVLVEMRIVPTLQRGNAALDAPASIFVRQLGLNGLVDFWATLNLLVFFVSFE